jgi:hypothetical protein
MSTDEPVSRLSFKGMSIALRLRDVFKPPHKILNQKFYNDSLSFKHCEIRMKINAGPSGLAVISLQKAEYLIVSLMSREAKKDFCNVLRKGLKD